MLRRQEAEVTDTIFDMCSSCFVLISFVYTFAKGKAEGLPKQRDARET